jgi:hypothetical protein
MPNPLFNVDRRPCAHLSGAIAFGGNDARWSSSANYCLPSYDTATGLRYSGVTADSAIGVQETLKSMTYLYDRGIRRFMINSPAGNVFTGGIPAYGGIWSPMSSRYVIRTTDNAKIPNPYPECWRSIPGQTSPPTIVPAINAADLDTLPFNSTGRVNEWRDQLKLWLVGSFGYSAHSDAEVYIYTGYGIPTKISGSDIVPDYTANYVREMGMDKNILYMNKADGFGFQMPDPDKNSLHDTYLRTEWLKWIEAGICGVGADVGVYGWNHKYGSWVYNAPGTPDLSTSIPANAFNRNTNMRRWFERFWNSLPKGNGTGQRFSNTNNFSYFLENFPWDTDPNNIINRTTSNSYPTPNTNEYYSFWNPLGGSLDSNSTPYGPGWMHYSKFLILQDALITFTNNAWVNGPTNYNGADPNRKWKFDPTTTEIHLLALSLARPFTADTDPVLATLSSNISSPETQAIIQDCVDWWLYYYQDCGYVYQSLIYHDSYAIQKHIHKGVMQGLGYWPVSDPAP